MTPKEIFAKDYLFVYFVENAKCLAVVNNRPIDFTTSLMKSKHLVKATIMLGEAVKYTYDKPKITEKQLMKWFIVPDNADKEISYKVVLGTK